MLSGALPLSEAYTLHSDLVFFCSELHQQCVEMAS